jgi:hypothetical protein
MAMSWAISTSYVCLSHCICGKMDSKVIGVNLFPHELSIIVNIPVTTLFLFYIQNVKRVIAVARLHVAQPTYAHAHNMHLIYKVTSTVE